MIKHFFQLFKRKGEEFCHQVKVKISLGFLADFYSILFKLRYQILFHNNQPKKFSVCFNNSCFFNLDKKIPSMLTPESKTVLIFYFCLYFLGEKCKHLKKH